VNRRAMRKHRLQNRAWALIAALLLATGAWASEDSDSSAIKPEPTSSTMSSVPSNPGNTDSSSARPKIPLPRRFTFNAIQAQNQVPSQSRPRMPTPRQFAAQATQPQLAIESSSVEPPSNRNEPQPVGSLEGRYQPLNAPRADSNIETTTAHSVSAQTAMLAPSVEPESTNSKGESATPTTTPASSQAMPTPVAKPGAANHVAEPAPQSSTTQPARMPEIVEVEPRTTQVTNTATSASAAPGGSGVVVKDNLNADLAPVQSPSRVPAQAARPASMPEAVNQALKVLAAPPLLSLESTSTSASSPVPEGNRESSPNQGATTDQNAVSSKVKPEAVPKSDTEPSSASPPIESQARIAAAQNPEAKQTGSDSQHSDDEQVERAGCSTCGGFHSSNAGADFHASMGCASGSCIPGRPPCNPPCNEHDTVVGAFCQNLYDCLCCPDPCYQPTWVPAANASFFADYARPRTVTRIRYDNLEAMTRPDRNQFFINQVALLRANPNRIFTNPRARLQQVSLYQEAAGERGSFFVEYPYRQINSNWEPTQAGFGDVNFGTKSLLFDCEMLQVTFQMRTYMPSGNFKNNLGTGQFVVDPSILTSMKLSPTTYFQSQFGNWVPVGGPGGNSKLAGGVFYWLMSFNQVLWHATPDSPLIATLEMDGWSFENGGYTAFIPRNQTSASGQGPGGIVEKGGGVSYFNIGPGLRQSVCNRLDFGGAITWATDTAHWAQPWFRFEVRFLF
jgi:hypothetical protein